MANDSQEQDDMQEIYNDMQDDDHAIILKKAINMRDLCGADARGVEFEVDDMAPEEGGATKGYNEEDIYKYLNRATLGGEDDEEEIEEPGQGSDDEDSPFQIMARKMENLTEDGGVKKKILQEGTGPVVPDNVEVHFHYNGYTEHSDEPYDSTRLRKSKFKYLLGCGEMIPGLEMGIRTMRKNEEMRLLVSPDYAFGARGCAPRVPENATILFEVELINWVECNHLVQFHNMTMEERRDCDFKLVKKVSNHYNEDAREKFKMKKYIPAMRLYMKAIRSLDKFHPKDEEEENEWRAVLIKMYLNTAVCMMKLVKLNQVINNTREVLGLDPTCVKAMFLQGKAWRKLGEFDRAKHWLMKARKLQPKEKDINKELTELDKTMARFKLCEKNMCQKMFASSTDEKGKEGKENKQPKQQTSSEPEVSESFKKAVTEQLKTFIDDSSLMELPLPCKTFAVHELAYVMEVAEEMGLDHTGKEDVTNAHIRLCKQRPEGDF